MFSLSLPETLDSFPILFKDVNATEAKSGAVQLVAKI